MFKTFIQTPQFSRTWDELGYKDEDLRLLELDIIKNSKKYPVIQGTGGLRKMRWQKDDKGKRSGIRICFIDITEYDIIFLMILYAKKEQEELTENEKKIINNNIKEIKNYLKNKGKNKNE